MKQIKPTFLEGMSSTLQIIFLVFFYKTYKQMHRTGVGTKYTVPLFMAVLDFK